MSEDRRKRSYLFIEKFMFIGDGVYGKFRKTSVYAS